MNRRDFLLFRAESHLRIAELSCERLYMRFADAQWWERRVSGAVPTFDPAAGEPDTAYDHSTADDLFSDVRAALAGADVVRLCQTSWLSDAAFQARVEALLGDLRAAGTRIED